MAEVSVLMAVYNGMPYLKKAVDSILRQTYADWKFVIVNDGSTDGSKEYLDSIKDERFIILDQDNQGLAASLNNGLKLCETEYVARLDSDDICSPNRLESQLEYMKSHPDVVMLGTQIERLGERGSGFKSSLPCEHDAIVTALLAGKHTMCHPTIMCRTQAMVDAGGYWDHPIAQDWDIYLKLSEIGQVANLPDVHLKYRIHSGSLNGQKLAGIRFHQRYAAFLARRRQNGQEWMDVESYRSIEKDRSWVWQLGEKVNVFAMRQYRLALTNILGGRSLLGYVRLGFAAGCSPKLTVQRIARFFWHRTASNQDGSHFGVAELNSGSN